ncbi:MAG TPA: hypothetical protein PKN32_10770 [Bacteroidales bacterium]|nr:hypothetical protein [Bacteroidales bacterium]
MISLKKLYNSPTLNTWFSFCSKSLGALVFLPILLKTFNIQEIALYFLFLVFISFQNLLDFGFYNTFVRAIAYADGGAEEIKPYENLDTTNIIKNTNWNLIERIIGTMNVVYKYITIFVFIVLLTSTLSVYGKIQGFENPLQYWISWIIIICVTTINFYGRIYSNYLLGLNYVALVRRWEGIFAAIAVISNIIVLIITKSFLATIISYQFWTLINIFRNKYLANKVLNKKYKSINNKKYDKLIFKSLWPVAWKSGIAGFSSNGVISIAGIIYSHFGANLELAQYLFSVKILDSIQAFSKAPIYSKLPQLSKYVSLGNKEKWVNVVKRGISLGNGVFIFSVIILTFFGEYILQITKSNMEFPNITLWTLLSIAFFIHFNGAFHTQIYMTTNKVNAHISDTISGIIFITTSLILLNTFGVMAFPIGLIAGYFGFYFWWAIYFSKQIIGNSFYKLMFQTTIIYVFLFIIAVLIKIVMLK